MGNNQPSARKKTYYISLAILAGMFFIFGFVSWVNSILIPYFRISCELTHQPAHSRQYQNGEKS